MAVHTPAYMKIREYVSRLVFSKRNGSGRIKSENELCQTFGVSRPTVRQALQALSEEGLIIKRKGMGTYINPTIVQVNKGYSIGIVVSKGATVNYNYYYGNIISGISGCLADAGINFSIINLFNNKPGPMANEILILNFDGIIWLNADKFSSGVINILEEKGTPVMVAGFTIDEKLDQVSCDFTSGAYLAADHLLSKGFSKFLVADAPKGNPYLRQKIHAGITRACAKHNVSMKKRVVFFDYGSRKEMTAALTEMNYKAAFFPMNFSMPCCQFCLDNNIHIPEELYVVAWDNNMLRVNKPFKCKVIRYPLDNVGTQAAQEMLNKISKAKALKKALYIKPKLVDLY